MSGTDFTLTPNYGLYKPVPDADVDEWGDHLNDNADTLDTLIKSVSDAQMAFLPLAGGTMRGPLILAANPAVALGAATKQYVDTSIGAAKFLPLTGGVLAGPGDLTVNGLFQVGTAAPWRTQVTAKGNLMVGVNEPANMATAAASSGGHVGAWVIMAQNLASNVYYDGANWRRQNAGVPMALSIGGAFNFIGGTAGAQDSVATMAALASIDASGHLMTTGYYSVGGAGIVYTNYSGANVIALGWDGANFLTAYVNNTSVGSLASVGWVNTYFKLASAYTPNQSVDVGSGPTFANVMLSGGYFYVANNAAYYFGRRPSDGFWLIVQNGGLLMQVDTAGSLTAVGNITANAGLYSAAQQMVFAAGGSGRIMGFAPGWYWDWNGGNGVLIWTSAAMGAQWIMHSNGSCYNNVNWVGGYGAYQNLSDERMKSDISAATVGLDEILALEPISFTRIEIVPAHLPGSKMARPPEIGFSAQQVRTVIPEAVTVFGAPLPDGGGGPDDDDPTLSVSLDSIVAALVNAAKTLAAQNVSLAARLDALEAKGSA